MNDRFSLVRKWKTLAACIMVLKYEKLCNAAELWIFYTGVALATGSSELSPRTKYNLTASKSIFLHLSVYYSLFCLCLSLVLLSFLLFLIPAAAAASFTLPKSDRTLRPSHCPPARASALSLVLCSSSHIYNYLGTYPSTYQGNLHSPVCVWPQLVSRSTTNSTSTLPPHLPRARARVLS